MRPVGRSWAIFVPVAPSSACLYGHQAPSTAPEPPPYSACPATCAAPRWAGHLHAPWSRRTPQASVPGLWLQVLKSGSHKVVYPNSSTAAQLTMCTQDVREQMHQAGQTVHHGRHLPLPSGRYAAEFTLLGNSVTRAPLSVGRHRRHPVSGLCFRFNQATRGPRRPPTAQPSGVAVAWGRHDRQAVALCALPVGPVAGEWQQRCGALGASASWNPSAQWQKLSSDTGFVRCPSSGGHAGTRQRPRASAAPRPRTPRVQRPRRRGSRRAPPGAACPGPLR